jgi:site-specific DNA recombinase
MIREEALFTERKVFLHTFGKRIEIDNGKMNILFNLSMPLNRSRTELNVVLPFATLGGAEGIRTPDLLLAKEALSRLSYSPVKILYQQASTSSNLARHYVD